MKGNRLSSSTQTFKFFVMWMLQKQVLVGGLQVYAYFSETSQADVNRDLSAAKEFETEAQAVEFRDARAMIGWSPIKYNDPGAGALEPWELEK
jgi:hypothetical protein